MKNQFFTTAIAIFTFSLLTLCEGLFAQVPEKLNYQGIARDNAGAPLANQAIGIRISILNDDGTNAYVETHGATTNAFGLYTLAIGAGNPTFGTMQAIDWSGDSKSVKLEIDPAGSSNYTDLGTTELLSTPYALFAANGGGLLKVTEDGNTGLRRADTDPNAYGNIGEHAVDLSYASGDDPYSGATGGNSFAAGSYSWASGAVSTAMGSGSIASGNRAISIGHQTTASGNYSIAMGHQATASHDRSFVINNSSNLPYINSGAEGQMTMRFYGGYRLFTHTSVAWTGVSLAAGGNSWSSVSDSTKKENFLKADGQAFLQKIKTMRLGSWNYIGQEPDSFRHYGPMAQEFFDLFGNDDIGIIGNDTTIATADIDGVMMIAIQALINENEELKAEISSFESRNTQLESRALLMETRLNKIESALMDGNENKLVGKLTE